MTTRTNTDVTLVANVRQSLKPLILASLPSFGSQPQATTEDGLTHLALREIDDNEHALVFLGFDPQSLPAGFAKEWAGNFEAVLGKLTVENDELSQTIYGGWF